MGGIRLRKKTDNVVVGRASVHAMTTKDEILGAVARRMMFGIRWHQICRLETP